jgi:uncharacterized membrane protein YeaQ/YmgE (transglycosylase-associated protein family)
MNITMWVLAGGLLGWIGFSVLGYNAERGVKTSLVIGIAGGYLGGAHLAPLFGAAAAVPGAFSGPALFCAAALAATLLYAANVVQNRWDV